MNLSGQIRKFLFDLPSLPSEDLAQRAFFLHRLYQAVGLIWLASLAFFPLIDSSFSSRQFWGTVISIGITLAIFRWLLVGKYISIAGLLFTVLVWLILAFFSLVGTGLTDINFLILITLSPLLAGFAHGTITSVVVTCLNAGVGYWLAVREVYGILPVGSSYDPIMRQS
ncbi:MAG: hypothetical protein AAGD96_31470, partial [Chloroflexota bacterium]